MTMPGRCRPTPLRPQAQRRQRADPFAEALAKAHARGLIAEAVMLAAEATGFRFCVDGDVLHFDRPPALSRKTWRAWRLLIVLHAPTIAAWIGRRVS
jgi:hypothetical protein